MPSITEFKKQHKTSNKPVIKAAAIKVKKAEKRRPGRHLQEKAAVKVVEVENMDNHSDDTSEATVKTEIPAPDKIEINFPGSEVLRAKFPKSFETAQNVVTDWVNDGKFEEIPAVNHPLAKAAVQQGLLKAKELEKKVMASPVTEKVTMQAFTYAMKAQNLVKELKSKVNKK